VPVPKRDRNLDELDLVAEGDFAGFDDARQHSALALQLGAKTSSEPLQGQAPGCLSLKRDRT